MAQVIVPGPLTNNGAAYPVTMASEVGGLGSLATKSTITSNDVSGKLNYGQLDVVPNVVTNGQPNVNFTGTTTNQSFTSDNGLVYSDGTGILHSYSFVDAGSFSAGVGQFTVDILGNATGVSFAGAGSNLTGIRSNGIVSINPSQIYPPISTGSASNAQPPSAALTNLAAGTGGFTNNGPVSLTNSGNIFGGSLAGNATTATTATSATSATTAGYATDLGTNSFDRQWNRNAATGAVATAVNSLGAANNFPVTVPAFSTFNVGNPGSGVGVSAWNGDHKFFVGSGKQYKWNYPAGTQQWGANGSQSYTPMLLDSVLTIYGFRISSAYNTDDAADTLQMAGVPVSTSIPYIGGSVATAADHPTHGQIARAMKTPPICISSWTGATNLLNEASISNIMVKMSTNGFTFAMTNSGITPWLQMDMNVLWITNKRDANGLLAINTSAFPSGTKLIGLVQSNGYKALLDLNKYATPTNEVDLDFTLTAGIVGNAIPAMTPQTVVPDLHQLIWWGFDGVYAGDEPATRTPGTELMFTRRMANAVLYTTPQGDPTMRSINSVTLGTNAQGRAYSQLAIFNITLDFGSTPPTTFDDVNVNLYDGTTGWNERIASPPNQAVQQMNYVRAAMLYELPYATHGIAGGTVTTFGCNNSVLNPSIGDTNSYQWQFSRAAMCLNCIFISDSPSLAFGANVLNALTNATFLRIHQDPLCRAPWTIFDNGATNTSARYRELTDGQIALWLCNETNSTATITTTWSQMNLPTNVTYDVFSVWDKTDMGLSNNTFTATISPTNEMLYLLTPRYDNLNGANLVAGSVQDGALASTFLKTVPVGATNAFLAAGAGGNKDASGVTNVPYTSITGVPAFLTTVPAGTTNGFTPTNDTTYFQSKNANLTTLATLNSSILTNYNGTNLTVDIGSSLTVPVAISLLTGLGNHLSYVTNAAFTISSFAPVAGLFSSAYFQVSNSAATPIIGTISAAYRAMNTLTTNSITIGAGKKAWFYVDSFTGTDTNHANTTQP